MKQLFIFLIRFYQLAISPYFGKVCRFYPSCSCYACEAFSKHGAFKGLFLTLKRLSKCGPWSLGGYDPVPDIESKS